MIRRRSRYGWTERTFAEKHPRLYAVASFVVFVGGIGVAFIYLWLMAPAGAAYPR